MNDVTRSREPGIFGAAHRWTSVGIFALVFIASFENLAVTTVMPIAAAELDGEAFYALAFAAPLATGVLGMVVAGIWSDRRGPTAPLVTTTLLFAAGLLIVGTAPSMGVLVVGRLVQGLGGGAMLVPLFVLIARLYPSALRARVFAGFAAAWSLPALVGPAAAGAVAQYAGWRWAFLGVLVLMVPAGLMIARPLRRGSALLAPDPDVPTPPWDLRRIAWAAAAALAVLGLSLSAELDPAVQWPVAVGALAVAIVSLRPLIPAGTLRSVRGLPSVVLLRFLVAGSFFGTEVYVPYLLVREYDWSVTAAGLALSGAGVAWATASWAQARIGERWRDTAVARIGTGTVLVSLAALAVIAFAHLEPVLVIVVWIVAALGGGFVYPRVTTLTLALSAPEEQGFNSSALAIGDSSGTAVALAITGLISATAAGFGGVFAFAAIVALAAVIVSGRIRPRV